MNVHLRPLELRDLNAIETIERESYPTPWSRSMFASELAKPSSISLGAFAPDTGELVGYLIISRYVDAWHVMNVAVAVAHRRRGVARALLEEAERQARELDMRYLALDTWIDNHAARSLYAGAGFQEVAQTRGQGLLPGGVSLIKELAASPAAEPRGSWQPLRAQP